MDWGRAHPGRPTGTDGRSDEGNRRRDSRDAIGGAFHPAKSVAAEPDPPRLELHPLPDERPGRSTET